MKNKFGILLLTIGALGATPFVAYAQAPLAEAASTAPSPVAPIGGVNHFTGTANGRVWHDARENGYFDLSLPTSPTEPNLLQVTYWGGDANREFDVLVDGTKIKTQTLSNDRPGQFFTVDTNIPPFLTQGKTQVTVRFQSIR